MANAKLLKLQADIQKSFKDDRAAVFASDLPQSQIVSTGSMTLDFASGIGGFPHNRVIELAGEPDSGKSTLAIFTISSFLDAFPEKGAVILDLEHKLTPSWVEQLIGRKKMERLMVVQPDSAEQATDMYVKICQSQSVSIVLFDSIGGAPSQRVLNKSAEIGNIGGNALAITRFAQFAQLMSDKYDVCTIGVNQVRDDTDGYNRMMTPGGKAWKHACVMRIQIKRGSEKYFDKVLGEEVQVGFSTVCKFVKNHTAPPGRVATYNFYNIPTEKYGFGIDSLEEISRLSILTGVVEQKGAWYYHKGLPQTDAGDHKIRSKARLIDYIRDTPEFWEQIRVETLEALKSGEVDLSKIAPMSDPDQGITDSDLKGPNSSPFVREGV